MQLHPGARLGHYLLVAPLGAGGMGEVWRATDTRLGREVALKRLPDAFSTDPERLARFEREAKLLASLSHSGIATLFGVEDTAEGTLLAMELVPGEDLAERLKQGALSLEEALPIARQIAEALEEAHEKGIVHRDLKPANIKVAPDGRVKLLDFGLAKALAGEPAEGSSVELSHSPTITQAGTAAGLILGTAHYMAPEQARGKPVDKRADIWAFGVVLFEMLAGARPFAGETVSDVLASVLARDPDWSRLPALPTRLMTLLQRCLERDPRRRLRDIGEARLVLAEPTIEAPVASAGNGKRWLGPLACVCLLALQALLGALWYVLRRPTAEAAVLRYDVRTPGRTTLVIGFRPAVALSADGGRLAFVARDEGVPRLYARDRADAEARPISGTEGATEPVFSPDGAWLAFFTDNKLKKASLEGATVSLMDVADPKGLDWPDSDRLVLAPQSTGPIVEVSAKGGPPRPITKVDEAKGERSHRWPQLLPGGRAVL
ncbi:MAG TPA: protein kinase, partial [Thermoleophilia bacterium]|nr:protein kinase [Thermoleophilia bacterium]